MSSAAPIISGYLYQFQRSMLRVLELSNDSDLATFEGLEDIDLIDETQITAVQYKYYPAKVLTPSIVRWTVLEMLEAFANAKRTLRYELVIYCQTKTPFKLESVADLKRLAIYDERSAPRDFIQEHNYSDELLQRFMESFRFTVGISLKEAYNTLIAELSIQFHCSAEDAEQFYYPKAIELCMRLSTKPERIDRTISKAEFCKAIDGKSQLFARWNAEAQQAPEPNIIKSWKTLNPLLPAHSCFLLPARQGDGLGMMAPVAPITSLLSRAQPPIINQPLQVMNRLLAQTPSRTQIKN